MPLDVGDYLKATDHLTVVEHGAYMLLIMRYWQKGGLGTTDEKLIARYAHLTAEQWAESRDVLLALFDEGWTHKRIDAELAKAAEIIEKRRSAAEQRHYKSNAHGEHLDGNSSHAGVPPSPEPLPTTLATPVPEPEGARVSFEDVSEAYPRDPGAKTETARKAFERIPESERATVLAGAIFASKALAAESLKRNRSIEEGAKWVTELHNWLANGEWRGAAKLAEADKPSPDLAVIAAGTAEFEAIKKFRGRTPFVPDSGNITVPKSELEKAMAAA